MSRSITRQEPPVHVEFDVPRCLSIVIQNPMRYTYVALKMSRSEIDEEL